MLCSIIRFIYWLYPSFIFLPISYLFLRLIKKSLLSHGQAKVCCLHVHMLCESYHLIFLFLVELPSSVCYLLFYRCDDAKVTYKNDISKRNLNLIHWLPILYIKIRQYNSTPSLGGFLLCTIACLSIVFSLNASLCYVFIIKTFFKISHKKRAPNKCWALSNI